MNKELINRIRENKYLTKNETDFIIKALEENSSLREQVNMWQSEHAKRVIALGRLHKNIKKAREEIKSISQEVPYRNQDFSCTISMCETNEVLEILDKLISESEKYYGK